MKRALSDFANLWRWTLPWATIRLEIFRSCEVDSRSLSTTFRNHAQSTTLKAINTSELTLDTATKIPRLTRRFKIIFACTCEETLSPCWTVAAKFTHQTRISSWLKRRNRNCCRLWRLFLSTVSTLWRLRSSRSNLPAMVKTTFSRLISGENLMLSMSKRVISMKGALCRCRAIFQCVNSSLLAL